MCGQGLLRVFEERAKERQREAGGNHGNQHTKANLPVNQRIDEAPKRTTSKPTPQSADIVAKAVGTNRQYVSDAKKIAETSPEVAKRELTSSQRAAVAVKILGYYEENALKRKQEAGREGGVESGKSRRGETKDEELIPHPSGGRSPQARDQAAAAVGVNPRYVQDAKKIAEKSPETLEQIRCGEKTIPEGRRGETKVSQKIDSPSGHCRRSRWR